LVDGGLVDNVPADIARLMGMDIVIAVAVSGDFTDYRVMNVLQILNQSIYIQGQMLTKELLKSSDFIIEPKVRDVTAMDLWRSRECIDAGIMETRTKVADLKYLIMHKTFSQIIEEQ
jgi:NTE family protein